MGSTIQYSRTSAVPYFEHDTFKQYAFSDKVKAGIYEDFEMDFAEISIE